MLAWRPYATCWSCLKNTSHEPTDGMWCAAIPPSRAPVALMLTVEEAMPKLSPSSEGSVPQMFLDRRVGQLPPTAPSRACSFAFFLLSSPARLQSEVSKHLLAQRHEPRGGAVPRVRHIDRNLRENARRPVA